MAKAETPAQWFEAVAPEMVAIASALRDDIEKTGPGLECKLAWGFPCWSGNERIFSIIAHKAHCNLQLWSGARLAPNFPNHIQGTGKALRHVKIRKLVEIDDHVKAIIAAAIQLDRDAPEKVR